MFGDPLTVTVVRSGRDAFGDPTAETRHTISGCGILRHSTGEERDSAVTETATLALPGGSDIGPGDAVHTPDGSHWHVNGRPYDTHSPLTGWEPAMTAPLRKVTG